MGQSEEGGRRGEEVAKDRGAGQGGVEGEGRE
jgi:hypothetical protein